MAFPPQAVQQSITLATTGLLPRSVKLWRNSSISAGSGDSASPLVVSCSSCQEPRDRDALYLLPDCFRCNGLSTYICESCHQYIASLLSAVEVNQSTLQAWRFQASAPINLFDLYRERALEESSDHTIKEELKRVLPFVPKLVLDMVYSGTTTAEYNNATIVIVDVSGYTALAEELAGFFGEGNVVGQASGAEALVSEGLNRYFEDLVRNVHNYGGDVIKFAGDALICLFNPSNLDEDDPEEAMRICARNAVFCATIAAQTLTRTVQINSTTSKLLTCHCGVATGKILAWSVGDADRREVLLTGETLAVAGQALDSAGAHSVVIDRSTYMLTSDWIVTTGVASKDVAGQDKVSDAALNKARKLLGNPHPSLLPRSSVSSQSVTSFMQVESVTVQSFVSAPTELQRVTNHLDERFRKAAGSALLSFVSRHVPKPATGPRLMNEMRRVSTVFTKLFEVGLLESKVSLRELFRECQRIVSSFGGLIRQFIVDDKGCVLISVFGVASFTDVDDSSRALTCAVRLAHELAVPTSSGVATGVVFVGIVGWAGTRCEFAVVGDSVNLAARLMSLASKAGEREVRCDEATAAVSSDRIEFNELEPVMLKGKSKPTRIYIPSITRANSSHASLTSSKSMVSLTEKVRTLSEDAFIGRENERNQVIQFVKDVRTRSAAHQPQASSVAPGILLVIGKTGFGKSCFMEWASMELADDSCVLKTSIVSTLAEWVELAAAKCLGGEATEAAIGNFILEKLKERKYRTSLASIPFGETPNTASPFMKPADKNPQRSRRKSLSFSASPVMPTSPMNRRDPILALNNYSSLSGGGDRDSAQTLFFSHNDGANGTPRPTRGMSMTNILPAKLSGDQVMNPSNFINAARSQASDQLMDWLFSEGDVTIPGLPSDVAESTRNRILEMLFLSLVRDLVSQYGSVILILDDADQASDLVVKTCLAAAQEYGVALVGSAREDDPRISCFSSKKRIVIHLGPMTDQEIMTIVRNRFNFETCPQSVWSFVLQRSEGNPQMACEYFRALLRQQFVVHSPTTKRTFELSPGKSDEDLAKVTPLEGSILNSFDTGLSPMEKDIIRLGTVICSADQAAATVSSSLLRNIYLENLKDSAQLDVILERLSASLGDDDEAYLVKSSQNKSEYLFANVIVRNVIYRTMTFAERSQIHSRIAQWLQASRGWDLLAVPIIVHHLVAAGEKRQAFEFLWSISALLLKEGPFADAAAFLARALDIAVSLQAQDLLETREISEMRMATVLVEMAREGRLGPEATAMLETFGKPVEPLSPSGSHDRLQSKTSLSVVSHPGSPRAPSPSPTRVFETLFGNSSSLSQSTLIEIRKGCVVRIWCAMTCFGDVSMLNSAFGTLIGTLPMPTYTTERLFLTVLNSALSAPLRGKGRTKFDIGILERTVDVALQLCPPDVAGLGIFATAISLLLFRRPFPAERMARNALAKLKDALYGPLNLLALPAGVPVLACLQLIAMSQTLCGGLVGADQSLQQCLAIAEKLELPRYVAWTHCSQAVLRFKMTGSVFEEDVAGAVRFDWQSFSELDEMIAWTASALSSRQEREWFAMGKDSLGTLRNNRFCWWLSDCLEGAVYCGIMNRAEWCLALIEEFYVFARNTLQVVLPVVLRLEGLVRAQRGEDVRALTLLKKARKEAHRYNILYEAHLSDFILRHVFRDAQAETGSVALDDFRVFGCDEDFSITMRATLRHWVMPASFKVDEDRWTKARAKRKGSLFTRISRACFGGDDLEM